MRSAKAMRRVGIGLGGKPYDKKRRARMRARLCTFSRPSLLRRAKRLDEDKSPARIRHEHHTRLTVPIRENVRAVSRRLHPRGNRARRIGEAHRQILAECV